MQYSRHIHCIIMFKSEMLECLVSDNVFIFLDDVAMITEMDEVTLTQWYSKMIVKLFLTVQYNEKI